MITAFFSSNFYVGDEYGQFWLAMTCEKNDKEKELAWYTKSAEQGFARAQHTLASLYLPDPDPKKQEIGEFWYNKAKSQGYDISDETEWHRTLIVRNSRFKIQSLIN